MKILPLFLISFLVGVSVGARGMPYDHLAPRSELITKTLSPEIQNALEALEAQKDKLYHQDENEQIKGIVQILSIVGGSQSLGVMARGIVLLGHLLIDRKSSARLDEKGELVLRKTDASRLADIAISQIISLDRNHQFLEALNQNSRLFLENPDWIERIVSIWMIQRITESQPHKAEEAFLMMMKRLEDPDPLVRLTADQALEGVVKLNPARFLSLLNNGRLKNGGQSVNQTARRRLLYFLAKVNGERTVTVLETIAQNPREDVKTRVAAVKALHSRGEEGSLKALEAVLEESKPKIPKGPPFSVESLEWLLLHNTTQRAINRCIEVSL